MAGYKLSAAILNRTKSARKLADGQALFFRRNADGTLTAWQRVKADGRERDVKVATAHGEVTQDWLRAIREQAYTIKTTTPAAETPAAKPAMQFHELWTEFTRAVMSAAKPLWRQNTFDKLDARMIAWVADSELWCMAVTDIAPNHVADALQRLKQARPKLFPSVLNDIRRALDWALADGTVATNAAAILAIKLKSVERAVPHDKLPASTDLAVLGGIVRAIETSNLSGPVRAALTLQAYTCQRTSEVANARWDEYDATTGLWVIPRGRMKVSEGRDYDQALPLPPIVRAALAKLPRDSEWMFPSRTDAKKAICKELLPQALVRLGYKGVHCAHGWRSAVRTIAADATDQDDRPLFNPQWVEDLLDHGQTGVQAHYTRDKAIKGVGLVLAWWADQLEAAKNAV